jgi:hypothetical protein
MRKVLKDRHEVAHVWAAQSQPEGRAGNVWFDGPTIYSYGRHFPMATFARPDLVLFNDDSSSVTTNGKHKPAVWGALYGHAARVIRVEGSAMSGPPRDVLASLVRLYNAALLKAGKARTNTEMHLGDATRIADDIRHYAKLYKLRVPKLAGTDSDALAALVKKQQAAKRADNIKRAKEYATREAELRAKYDATLVRWLAGESVQLNWGHAPGAPTVLRIVGDMVETSRGARVSLEAARRLWPLVQVCRAGGLTREYEDGLKVDGFELREIRADGTAVIGCHTLSYEAMRPIAAQLGLVTP